MMPIEGSMAGAPGAGVPAPEAFRLDIRDESEAPSRWGRQPVRNARWVRAGEIVEVAGTRIAGGMLYVGTSLPQPGRGGNENCLVNTKCKVATSGADVAGRTVDYWPSYGAIRPTARRAYVDWLAGGRSDPSYSIGYVFLFLYGLEYRLFVDGAVADAGDVAAELRRLLAIYDNRSFQGYGRRLAEFAEAAAATECPSPSVDLCGAKDLRTSVRFAIGRKVAAGESLSADEALAWVLAHPATRRRAVFERCLPEIGKLWRARFEDDHPHGLVVEPPERHLRLSYQAASATFSKSVGATWAGKPIPDVLEAIEAARSLRERLEDCAEDLDRFSRHLGARPDARGTPAAAALLPRELADLTPGSPLGAMSARIEGMVGGGDVVVVPVGDLLSALGILVAPNERVCATHGKQAGDLLEKIGFGFEPDTRYGDGGVVPDGVAAVFAAAGGAPVDSRWPAYRSARLLIEAAGVAAAQGDDRDSFDALVGTVASDGALEATEVLRLRAFAAVALSDRARHRSASGRVARAPATDRRGAARAAVAALLRDGREPTPAEVAFLERLHGALRLVDGPYGALHRGVTDEPIVVAMEEPYGGGVRIPQETDPIPLPARARVVAIDANRLARIRSETSQVSSMLAGIFVEEADAARGAIPPRRSPDDYAPVPQRSLFAGLDEAHGRLLAAVLCAGSMPRTEYESAARGLGLLPDGAVETVNEWAFDRLGEPVLDDGVAVAVPGHLAAGLTAEMETA